MKKNVVIIGSILIIVIGLGILTTKVFLNSDEKVSENTAAIEEIEGKDSNRETLTLENTVGVAIGNTAPDFTLENINGEMESLKDYRGKNIVLNFFRTT